MRTLRSLGLRLAVAVLLLMSIGWLSSGCSAPAGPHPPVGTLLPGTGGRIPSFSHVFVILMENKSYTSVIGSDDAPYINQLARDYALLQDYYAISHPSLPNYLALVSGSTQGITNDCPDCSVDAPNLVDQLDAHRKSWRAYIEDMPGPCFNGTSAGVHGLGQPLYVRRHNPLIYFSDISGNPARCNQTVPLARFSADLQANKLPDFVWISPNTVHDMHDGSVRDGDNWLASFLPSILGSSAWKDNGVVFLVWDEGASGDNGGCCGNAAGGHTIALVIAANGKQGFQSSTPYSHYSLLRTIEEGWQLGTLAHTADPGSSPMSDLFVSP